MTATDLDAPETYERLDAASMGTLIAELPAQCRTAWQAGQDWGIPTTFERPDRVVVLGVGGSAIGAELVAALAAPKSSVPIHVVRGYVPPAVGDRTLVVAASHSGETEETIGAFNGTLATRGMRLAMTTGGTLSRAAESLEYPVFRYEFDGMPRAAIGWGVFPLLALLSRLDVLPCAEEVVGATLAHLDRSVTEWNPAMDQRANTAKQIAARLHGRVPVIVGSEYLGVVARRWSSQFNENAKQWSFHTELPEANHNVIAGLGAPILATASIHVLLLTTATLHERNRLRIRLTAAALDRAGIAYDEISVDGADPLAAAMRATMLGDWVSFYLAMLNGVDPTPVEPLEQMKRSMREHLLVAA